MRCHARRTLLLALSLSVAAPIALARAAPRPPVHALREDNPHAKASVGCVDCHGTKKPTAPATAATCLGCHGPSDELVKKTAEVKPENPHTSPHWGTSMECSVCHRQHRPTVNWCASCHTFDGKVP